jgi:hypothetical protein
MIQVGQRLTLSSWHPHKAWLNRAALAAVPAPAPPKLARESLATWRGA